MKLVTIQPKPIKSKPKGFDPNIKTKTRKGWRHVAVELNNEIWDNSQGFPDFRQSEILDVLEIHHLVIAPVTSKIEQFVFEQWAEMFAGSIYVSPTELLAELYTSSIAEYALSIGANVGRIYHNSCLGDTRIHGNSIGHVFESSDTSNIVGDLLVAIKKYVVVEHIADGSKITLKNRLGI